MTPTQQDSSRLGRNPFDKTSYRVPPKKVIKTARGIPQRRPLRVHYAKAAKSKGAGACSCAGPSVFESPMVLWALKAVGFQLFVFSRLPIYFRLIF